MHGLLTDIGLTVIVGAIVVIVISRLKQPLIFGYLLTGMILGPEFGPTLIEDPKNIEVISEIGLVLLLFIIGLEMNPKQLAAAGKKILFPGLLQFPLSVGIGFIFFHLFKSQFSFMAALYLAIFCSLSSTAIVVKLLYDKLEMDTLYGRVSIGILILQDIWAILILAMQPNFANPKISVIVIAILKSAGLLLTGFLISKYFLEKIFHQVYKTPELVVVLSIGWCAMMAAAGESIGLSMEMGALIAGISISTFPYSIHVTARVSILRDFFLSLFFVSLGMKIPMPHGSFLDDAALLVGFLFFIRAVTVFPLMIFSGSSRRTAFFTTITLSQISEFSLVIATIGISLGHINSDILAIVLYAMSITAIVSSYMIKYNHQFYEKLHKILGYGINEGIEKDTDKKNYPIVVLGCHRGAQEMIDLIADLNPRLVEKILVVDYNIESLKELQLMKVGTLFGDISSIETLTHANLQNARIILSTIPDMLLKGVSNEKLIQICKSIAPEALVVATAESDKQAEKLKKAGADKILMPYAMIGDALADFLFLESRNF